MTDLSRVLDHARIAELPNPYFGKVRDCYDLPATATQPARRILISSDRISAFDCVLPNAIPHKGQVLTQISRFWFGRFAEVVPNHLVTTEIEEFPDALRDRLSSASKTALAGRAMLVRRGEVVPFECVVRGYLAGSGWKEYQQTGAVCGHKLPEGLVESSKLPAPIFTPATKAEEGHDINVSIAEMAAVTGESLTRQLEAISLKLYGDAARYAEERGIIICDTKFEFGVRNGQLMLIDEVLTPDSSRFWPREAYRAGQSQPSFDKQYVRDYLETLDWDKHPPAPVLPDQIVSGTSARYLEAYRLITGHDLPFAKSG